MKGKLLTFLILPAVVFSASLIFFAMKVSAQTTSDGSACVASTCGTSTGTKQVPIVTNVCDKGCPTVSFNWTEKVYDNCPIGYSVYHTDQCKKDNHPDKGKVISRPSRNVSHSVNVLYEKSHDPHKCHRPADSTLGTLYGITHDEVNTFKHVNDEWMYTVDVNCHDVVTGSQTVSCNDAPVIACEGTCPTTCGYEGGTVPNGLGGNKTCAATEACPVAQECPTTCGYEGGTVPDGQGGSITCEATAACEQPKVCEYNSELTADDPNCKAPVVVMCQYDNTLLASSPLCVPKDTDGEVKGVTDVVTAHTAGGLNEYAYVLQAALILITANLFVAFGKEYLKK